LAILCNPNRGSLVCIDEPETGLHPDMIAGIGRLINEVSTDSNMIISTHSAHLLNSFEIENIRVIEKDESNATKIFQYTIKDFEGWYEDFSPETMWRNGDLGGNRW
jgi:predicted ATPase